MRKFISITFVILFLFNFLGYYWLFLGIHHQNTKQLMLRFDTDNFEPSETVTIKIPISIPYAMDSEGFERVDGEFEHNGEFYRLVKQRLYHDTLYIVCIKDQESKQMMQALTNYVKTFTDKPENTKHNAKTIPGFIKDYLSTSFDLASFSQGWNFSFTFRTAEHHVLLLPLTIPSPPPEV